MTSSNSQIKPALTRILTVGCEGADVAAMCAALNTRGYEVSAAEHKFTKALRDVVIEFQFKNNDISGKALLPDGIVGLKTWTAIFGKTERAAEDCFAKKDFADWLCITAKKYLELHIREDDKNHDGIGDNSGPYIDDFIKFCNLEPPQPWCAAFVCWCLNEAAEKMGLNIPLPNTASCPNLLHWYEETAPHKIVNPATMTPARGDIGFIYFPSMGRVAHTFVVTEIVLPDTIITIEGNTCNGGSRDGVGIFRRFRPMNQLYACGRIIT